MLQRTLSRAGARTGNLAAWVFSCSFILRRFFLHRGQALRKTKFYTGASGFRESNRNCLLRRSCPVFAFAYVMNFFPHEFSCLGGWGLPLAGIFTRSVNCFLFGHKQSSSEEI